jgi:DNA-binding MarR family transcriptional regulator/predicted GNAT family acetyltransferase
MSTANLDDTLESVRRFNRFYTQFVGALDADFLGTTLTLPEARVLFEIARAADPVAADIQSALAIDGGYLSRILARFEDRGWISRPRAESDGRRRPIILTQAGFEAFTEIDGRQRERVAQNLAPLTRYQRDDLSAALNTARFLLAGAGAPRAFTLRPFREGDMGMIIARQSLLYREVYGWGPEIEINIGESATNFLRGFKPGREQCWIAQVDGVMAGSVLLTDEREGLSRLRLLYVEPSARGLGIGNALVAACLTLAREVGYRAMTLWTHTVLESARRIYAGHGFRIVETHTHTLFGPPVQSETWRKDLA